jgi:flagellar basal-body rod protein FlgB
VSGLFAGVVETLRQASSFALRRHELIAENVANADTPNFRAHDLSFTRELDLAQLVRSRPDTAASRDLDVRIVDAPDGPARLDGNDVDIDRQMTRLTQNAGYHNVVVHLLNARFTALKSAIHGR